MDYTELLKRLDPKIRLVELDRKRAVRSAKALGTRARGLYIDACESVFWLCVNEVLSAAEAGDIPDHELREDVPGLVFDIARAQKWVSLPEPPHRPVIVLAGFRSDPWLRDERRATHPWLGYQRRETVLREDVSEDEQWRRCREQFLSVEWMRDLIDLAMLRRAELQHPLEGVSKVGNSPSRKNVRKPLSVEGERRAAFVDNFIDEMATLGRKVSKADLWKQIGYRHPEEFNKWQRGDPRAPSDMEARLKRVMKTIREGVIAERQREKIVAVK